MIGDLSTYVHSIPPAMWMSTLGEAFLDAPRIREIFAVWLRIANFYFARSVSIVLTMWTREIPPTLTEYLQKNQYVFVR